MNLISKKRRTFSLNSAMLLAGTVVVPVVTQYSPVSAEEAANQTGWVDVYVDHTKLDEAISQAESAGVTVVHDNSVVLTGDADKTVQNTKTATDYYKTKETELRQTTAKYKADLANYEAEQKRNDQNAANANAAMSALRANLSANGQTIVSQSKEYSEAAVTADTKAIQASIDAGKHYKDLQTAVTSANALKATFVSYQTQADQGNIKLVSETVKVSSAAEIQAKMTEMAQNYTNLEAYVAGLGNQTGSIPDAQRPTYKVYEFAIADSVVNEATKPVTVFNYTPVQAVKPAVPVVNYHFYDVRSTPTTDRHAENKDGETIIEATKESSNGKKVVQAMVNQTVGVETDNQPLPSGRFDKIHTLEIATYLPADVEWDEIKSNVDENWEATYNKATRIVKLRATAKYLVKVNERQNLNNAGTVGGTVAEQWAYDAPAVYFKLLKDDSVYQVHSETVVNDEYLVAGETITIMTNSANPEKHNYNSKMVNIDGKAVLPGSVNNYQIEWDFNQYKGVNIDREMQGKDLILADVYSNVALTYTGKATVTTKAGQVVNVKGIEEVNVKYTDLSADQYNGLKAKIEAIAKEQGGKAEDYSAVVLVVKGFDTEFYKNYVETGTNLLVKLPMSTNKIDNTPNAKGGTYNGNKYYNVALQSDFGNSYKSNTVQNNAPLLDPRKDAVLTFAQLSSMDIKKNPTAEIENKTEFFYRLSGSELPTNLSEAPSYYAFTDEMNVKADEYTGEYIVEANNPITFRAGTALYNRYAGTKGVMEANSDVTKYTTQTVARNVSKTINTPTGNVNGADSLITRVIIAFDNDFLDQIDWSKTAFQVDAFIKAKRIADVDNVVNEFNEVINSVDFGSTQVVTNTKINATDELRKQVEELTKRADEDDKDDEKFQKETVSALSVVVKTIQDNKKAQEAADDKLEEQIISNRTEIVKNAGSITSLNQLIQNLVAKVAENKTAIDTNTGAITDLNEKVATKYSNVTIYDQSVTNDAEALDWAVNHGISPTSIKSITVDKDNNLVVKYNVAEKAVTGSTPATLDSDHLKVIAKSRKVISLYTVKSDDEARKALEALGYGKDKVQELKNDGVVWTAVVTTAKTTPDVVGNAVNTAKEQSVKPVSNPVVTAVANKPVDVKEIKTLDDAVKFENHVVSVGGVQYKLVKAVSVNDATATYTAQTLSNGKVGSNIKVVIPKETIINTASTVKMA